MEVSHGSWEKMELITAETLCHNGIITHTGTSCHYGVLYAIMLVHGIMDTMGVILTFAPKMNMYVTTISPCPFSTAICMHFIFSFVQRPQAHAKSLVWEFQHSKA